MLHHFFCTLQFLLAFDFLAHAVLDELGGDDAAGQYKVCCLKKDETRCYIDFNRSEQNRATEWCTNSLTSVEHYYGYTKDEQGKSAVFMKSADISLIDYAECFGGGRWDIYHCQVVKSSLAKPDMNWWDHN